MNTLFLIFNRCSFSIPLGVMEICKPVRRYGPLGVMVRQAFLRICNPQTKKVRPL